MSEFFGTLPQWLSAGALVTFVGLILRYDIGKRKVSADSAIDIRRHYAEEVAALRARIVEIEAHYREMLRHSDEQHEVCKQDRDELRAEVSGLKSEIDGLKRQMSRYSTNKLMILEDDAPQSAKAAKRIKSDH